MARISALFKAGTLDAELGAALGLHRRRERGRCIDRRHSTGGGRQSLAALRRPRLIVTTDEQFGLGRMYQALGDPKTETCGITRSVADADAFIARERLRLGIAI